MTRDVILTLSLLLVAGLFARLLATLLHIPEIVFLLGLGALLGPSALDVIDVPLDSLAAQLVFTLGVSTILFYGGLNLSLEILRKVWVSLGLLSVLGVIVTAVITGAAAALVFGLPFEQGLLMGAVLSPTDPAILIPLFIGSRLRAKVAQTVVAESAFNDPTGAVLALAIAGALVSGQNSLTGPAGDFVGQLALSTAGGVLAGIVLSAAISSRRTGIWRESAAIAVLAVVAMSYVSLDFAGGSGYLGAFLAGLIVGNMKMLGLSMHDEHNRDLIITTRSLADIVTIFVFVLVGVNLPFHALGAEILPALAVVAVLLLVARPITVAICCLPDRRSRWSRAELAFVCWTRETGVVPAALVGVLAALAVPNGDLLASVVALAIIVTLAVQAIPAPWLARRLGLLEVD
ncbi:MAG TPA: cation:proton antiporter [Solirubrobacteraceae bacterium]|jgi:cell volume regulation protein A|nr:cation:proton antiporter [Solirubrobacteraceae bacterium]